MAEENAKKGLHVGIMATEQTARFYTGIRGEVISVGDREKPETIAYGLYDTFREFDMKGVDMIFAEGIIGDEIELAIMNRIIRASGFNIVEVR